MELKGAKPGRFHPRCTGCKGKFHLEIFSDEARAPHVTAEHAQQHATVVPSNVQASAQSNVKTIAPAPPGIQVDVSELAHQRFAAQSDQSYDDLDSLLIGGTLGGYQVRQKLGAG